MYLKLVFLFLCLINFFVLFSDGASDEGSRNSDSDVENNKENGVCITSWAINSSFCIANYFSWNYAILTSLFKVHVNAIKNYQF